MNAFIHKLTAVAGFALAIIPHVVDVLPAGKVKLAVSAVGGVLLFITDKAKVLGSVFGQGSAPSGVGDP